MIDFMNLKMETIKLILIIGLMAFVVYCQYLEQVERYKKRKQ